MELRYYDWVCRSFFQILLPAFFVCLAMLVSQIRPVSEMPALELNTDMFLDLDPHEHYLAFALDDNGKSVLTQNMMDMLVQYPGVGELNNRPLLSASKI